METEFYYIENFEVFKEKITILPKKITASYTNEKKNMIDKIFDNQYIIDKNGKKMYKSYDVAKMLVNQPQLSYLNTKNKITDWLLKKKNFFLEVSEQFKCTITYLNEFNNENIHLVVDISERCSELSILMGEIINLMINDHSRLDNYINGIINMYYETTKNLKNNNINDNTMIYYINNLKNGEEIFFFEMLFIVRIQEYMRESLKNNITILKKVFK